MKKGIILATTLALTLGYSVAVSAQEAWFAKAETTSVSVAGTFTSWAEQAMTLDGE